MRQLFGAAAESFVGMGAPGAPAPQAQDTVQALTQLAELHRQGVLTDEEFQAQKAKLLG
jgi:hypothetical protein